MVFDSARRAWEYDLSAICRAPAASAEHAVCLIYRVAWFYCRYPADRWQAELSRLRQKLRFGRMVFDSMIVPTRCVVTPPRMHVHAERGRDQYVD